MSNFGSILVKSQGEFATLTRRKALLYAAMNMSDSRIRKRLTQRIKDGKVTTFNDMFVEVVELNEDYVGKRSESPVLDRNGPYKTIHCASHDEVQSSEETVHLADSSEQYPPEQTTQYDYEQGSIPLHQTFYDEAGGYRPSQHTTNQQRGSQSRPLWNPRQGQPHSPPPQSSAPVQSGYSQIMTRQPHLNQPQQNQQRQAPVQQFNQ